MKNPLDSLKAAWNDPKKRPWIMGGAGVAAGAAYLTMKKPSDPADQTEEAVAGAQAQLPEMSYTDTVSDPAFTGGAGQIPGVMYAYAGGYDPAFQETDFSSLYGALEQQAADLEAGFGEAIQQNAATTKQRIARVKARATKAQHKATVANRTAKAQGREIRQLRRQVARVKTRAKKGPKSKPKAKTKGRG